MRAARGVCRCACSLFVLELLLPGHRRRQKGSHGKKVAERAYGLPQAPEVSNFDGSTVCLRNALDRKQTALWLARTRISKPSFPPKAKTLGKI